MGSVSRPPRGNTLQISPPFVISDLELAAFVNAAAQPVADEGACSTVSIDL